jgi:hypothetical protein
VPKQVAALFTALSVVAAQLIEKLAWGHDPNITDTFKVSKVTIARYKHVCLRGDSQDHEIIIIRILSHFRTFYRVLKNDSHSEKLCDEFVHLHDIKVALEPLTQQHAGKLFKQHRRDDQLPPTAKERVNQPARSSPQGQHRRDEHAWINDCAGQHLPPLSPHRVQLIVGQRQAFRFAQVTAALHPADDALQPRNTIKVTAHRLLDDSSFRTT